MVILSVSNKHKVQGTQHKTRNASNESADKSTRENEIRLKNTIVYLNDDAVLHHIFLALNFFLNTYNTAHLRSVLRSVLIFC